MTTATPRTLPQLLERRLGDQPGSPLVTYYDDTIGERTELSVTSWANWVAKHANLFRDELDLDDDATVLVDLPAHWLVPVLLGGAWTAGLAVTTDPATPHDLVVTDVAGAARHGGGAAPVVACSLHPFALPCSEPLPAGVADHGHLWPGQSDVVLAALPPTGDETAWRGPEGEATMAALLEQAATYGEQVRDRLLTTRHPATDRGVPDLLVPLLGGSVVYVQGAGSSADLLEARAAQEAVTRVQHPGTAQPPIG